MLFRSEEYLTYCLNKEKSLTVNSPLDNGENPPDSLIPDSLIPDSLIPDSNILPTGKNEKISETIKPDLTKTKKQKPDIPPNRDDLAAYCLEIGGKVNPDKFYEAYEQKGWMVGKSKMVDWKSAVRNWQQNGWGSNFANRASPAKQMPKIDYGEYEISDREFEKLKTIEGEVLR